MRPERSIISFASDWTGPLVLTTLASATFGSTGCFLPCMPNKAVLTIHALMNLPNPKGLKRSFNKLLLRELRHKLSSHSTDYLNDMTGEIETYVPIQIGVTGFTCTFINNEGFSPSVVDLRQALEGHLKAMIAALDAIYEKTIKTLYKGQSIVDPNFRTVV